MIFHCTVTMKIFNHEMLNHMIASTMNADLQWCSGIDLYVAMNLCKIYN